MKGVFQVSFAIKKSKTPKKMVTIITRKKKPRFCMRFADLLIPNSLSVGFKLPKPSFSRILSTFTNLKLSISKII